MTDASTEAPAATGRRPWLALAVLVSAISISLINGTVLAVLMPEIIQDLDMTLLDAEWANAAYTLTFAALLLPVGWCGDRFGRKRMLLIGLVVFSIGSALVAGAASGGALIFARFVQGMGGAIISPSTLSTINATFHGRRRIVAFAIWGAAMGGAAAVGPLVGGWLGQVSDWRTAFWIVVPVAVAAFIGALLFVDESRDPAQNRRFDLLGAVLSIGAMVLIVFGLIEGHSYGWLTPTADFSLAGFTWGVGAPVSVVFASLLVGSVLAAMFVRHELALAASGGEPLADLRLFRYPSFRYGNVTVLIVMLGEFGVIFTLPLFLSVVLGFDTLTVGWTFVGLATGALVAGGVVPQLARRMPVSRLIVAGMVVEGTAAIVLALTLSTGSSLATLVPVLFFYGLGVGTASAQLTGAILSDVSPAESGQGSAIQSTARQLGSVLGTAVLGSILFAATVTQVGNALSDVPGLPEERINPIAEAIAQSGGTAVITVRDQAASGAFEGTPQEPFTEPVIDASVTGYTQATRITMGVGGGIILLGALSATRLTRTPPRTR